MVELGKERGKNTLDVEEINDKSGVGINGSFQSNLNPVRVTMHIVAAVGRRHLRQPVGGLEGKGLSDFHRIPSSFWV